MNNYDDEQIIIILNNEHWAGVISERIQEGAPDDGVIVFHFADCRLAL